jgi:peptidoglycan/LPS O-acetylase OafA/YrhL
MSQDSTNLDMLRSFAVLLVLFDHTLKFLGFSHFGHEDTDWIGRLGVVFFFVHTSLVLMMSLEREKLLGWRRPVNFYIRRAFRLFPLSCFVVLFTFAAHIPQIAIYPGGFVSAYIPRIVLASNLMLTQNLIPSGFNILGQLWSLPIELDMYLVLPLLFVLALRWPRGVLLSAWPVAVALALTQNHFSHLWRLNFLYYAPCFVPGVMAYAIPRRVAPKLNSWMWPVFLLGLLTVFLSHSTWQFSWLIALIVGLSVPFFVEQTNSFVNKLAHRIAKYSYGIYLGHTLCIWTAFSYLHFLPQWLQWLTFISLLIAIPYFYFITIERPGIYAGKRISNWLTVPPVALGR